MPGPFEPYDILSPELLSQLYAQQGYAVPQVEGPVTTPEGGSEGPVPLTTPSQAVSSPVPTNTGQSVSVARSGTNFDTLNRVDQRYKKGVDAELARSKAEIQGQQAAVSQGLAQAAGQEKDSILQRSVVTDNRKKFESEANRSLQIIEDDYRAKEEQIRAAEDVTHRQYMADYNRQRQEILATNINPAKLFSDMTGAEQSGILLTAFIHDFLGAKGIKTSSMDTYNKAIERSIDAQIQNLNTKKSGLSAFQQMWDMQRAQSQSDQEARARIHGIALEAFKAGVTSKIAEFDSDYARAEIPALIAGVDKALLNSMVTLDNMSRENIRGEANLILTKERDKVHAAQESARIALARRELDLRANQPKGRTLNDINKVVVRAEGGRVLGEARNEATAEDLQIKTNALEKLNRNIPRLQELQRKLGGTYQGPGKNLLNTKDLGELNSLYNEMISDIVFAKSGKAATDVERNALKEQIKLDTFTSGILGGGDVGEYISATFNVRQITDNVADLQNQLIPVHPDIAAALVGGTNFKPYEAETDAQKIITEGRDKPGESPVDKAIGKVYSEVSSELVAPSSKTTREEAREFFKDYAGSRDYTTKSAEYGLEDNIGEQVTPRVPTWYQGLSDLAFIAQNKSIYSDDERQEAINKLGELAHDESDESDVKYAAKYFLYKIATDKK